MTAAVALRRLLPVLLPALMLPLALTVHAHEGHELEQAEPAAALSASPAADAPRLALTAAQFELVAVRDATALLIYVDDYNSNAPLADLQLQVQGGTRSAQAQAVEAGVYRVPLAALGLEQGTAAPLRFIVRDAQWQTSVDGVLPAATAPVAQDRVAAWQRGSVLALIVIALLLVAVLLLRRRRRGAAS